MGVVVVVAFPIGEYDRLHVCVCVCQGVCVCVCALRFDCQICHGRKQ